MKKKNQTISIDENNKSKCLECGACYQLCELGAIESRYPPLGTGVIYEQG